MARDHLEIVRDKNGVGEPEPLDRVRDQLELLARMRPSVAGIGPQPPICARRVEQIQNELREIYVLAKD
jgi:hypothetical protein